MTTPRKVRAAVIATAEHALGLSLHPVSGRHWIALETIGSPVIGAAEPRRKPTLGDYATAALLLAQPPAEAAELAAQPAKLKADLAALLARHDTLADLQAAADAVVRRVAEAMGVDLTPAGRAPAEPPRAAGGPPADTPRDPT